MKIDSSAIKEIKVQKLQDFIDPNSKEDINLYCTIKIDNSFQVPERDCKVILQISNALQEEVNISESSDSLVRSVKSKNLKRKILDSIYFSKSYSSLGLSKTTFLNFNVTIKRSDFVYDVQSKYYNKNILDFDVFIVRKNKGVIFSKKKEIDLKAISLLRDKNINYVKNDKIKKEISLVKNLVKSVKLFENSNSKYAINADSNLLTEMQSEFSIHDYKLLLYFKRKNKTGLNYIKNTGILNSSIELELSDLTSESIKRYSNKNKSITENKVFKSLVDILNSNSDFYVNVVVYNKPLKKDIQDSNWVFSIKKDNIEDWFLGLFYNVYLPKFFNFNTKSQSLILKNEEINITFDKDRNKKLNYEDLLFDRYLEKVDVKITKKSLSNKKLVSNKVKVKILNDKIEETDRNITEDFVSFSDLNSYKGKNTEISIKSNSNNDFIEDYLKIEYKLLDDSKNFQKKSANVKIKKYPFMKQNRQKNMNSYYDISYIINESIKNNTQFKFNPDANIQNSINISFNVEDINLKEYYGFLGYENFEEFLKSLLIKVDCTIYESERELFNYNNILFLEKSYQSNITTQNIVENDISKYNVFTKNYSKDILSSNNLNAEYCLKIALVRKETYNKICLEATDIVKSLVYKDAYSILDSQNFTNLEKSINIIHSNNTSTKKARETLFDILYSKDFDYTTSYFIQSKE